MRPYRAIPTDKAIDSGEFVYGWYRYHSYYEIHIISYFEERKELADNVPNGVWREFEVRPSTVGQQVGRLCNSTKEEIYENDIMLSRDQVRKYVVIYNPDRLIWYLKGAKGAWNVPNPDWNEFKRHGNIHTNPDRLEN